MEWISLFSIDLIILRLKYFFPKFNSRFCPHYPQKRFLYKPWTTLILLFYNLLKGKSKLYITFPWCIKFVHFFLFYNLFYINEWVWNLFWLFLFVSFFLSWILYKKIDLYIWLVMVVKSLAKIFLKKRTCYFSYILYYSVHHSFKKLRFIEKIGIIYEYESNLKFWFN